MECIHWVAWRTSSGSFVWTCVSLSWYLHTFGRSKSSDVIPRAKESTQFDSPFQGKQSFETSSSSYTKKVSAPRRSGCCMERSLMERPSTYPYKSCWNPLRLSMAGGKMIWRVCCCLCSIQAFAPITTNTSQTGGEVAGFSWCACLVWQHGGMDSESSYLGKIATEQIFRGLQFSSHRAI